MAIKTRKRCTIGDGVIDLYRKSAALALENIYNTMQGIPARSRPGYLQKSRGDIARLNDIVKGISKPGRGIDLEVSRMKGIDFDTINLEKIESGTYLVAHTKGLIITLKDYDYLEKVSGKKRNHKRYDHGDYKIYVKDNILATPKIAALHFVPDLEPFATSRHYHHTAYYSTKEPKHPVQMQPSSCWGGFSGPLSTALNMSDFPELFRMLRIFVGRYNPSSPLGHPRFGRGEI